MNRCTGHFPRVFDEGDGVAGRRRNQHAGIAHLPAGFGVERRAVEDQLGAAVVFDDANNLDRRFERLAADEIGGRKVFIDRRDLGLVGAFPTGASTRPLLLHFGLEAFFIDGEATLASHLLLLVERQTECVVELERSGARKHSANGRLGLIEENLLGNLERGGVAMLFVLDHARDALDTLQHLRITGLHQLGDEAGEFVQVRILAADHAGITDSPPHDLAQHVTAPFVGWRNAVVNQEGSGADMIGIDAQGDIGARVVAVRYSEHFRRSMDDGAQKIGVVIRKLSLQDARERVPAPCRYRWRGAEAASSRRQPSDRTA